MQKIPSPHSGGLLPDIYDGVNPGYFVEHGGTPLRLLLKKSGCPVRVKLTDFFVNVDVKARRIRSLKASKCC